MIFKVGSQLTELSKYFYTLQTHCSSLQRPNTTLGFGARALGFRVLGIGGLGVKLRIWAWIWASGLKELRVSWIFLRLDHQLWGGQSRCPEP